MRRSIEQRLIGQRRSERREMHELYYLLAPWG